MSDSQKTPTWLLNFKKDLFSQGGEDGIIEEILRNLPENDKWCVEFGAWDGMFLSNTCNLIQNLNYSAVLIEAEKEKFAELKDNYKNNDKVFTVNAMVGHSKGDNLDKILKDLPIPDNFDFLSVDIDGNDYYIWKSITEYRPKVICIEFNPTIPTEVDFVQKADPLVNQGSSLLSLVRLGKEKNYELICVSSFNAFFVDSKYFHLFGISDNRPQVLREDTSFITYIFSGYDGMIHISGNKSLPWHNLAVTDKKMQHLPSCLRKFPGRYNKLESIIFKIFKRFS